MRRLTLLLISMLLLYACPGTAQFDPNITGYNIWVDRINDGQTMPVPEMVIEDNITLTLSWEQGTDSGPGYITPYQVSTHAVVWVPNTLELWNGTDSTSSPQDLSFTDGTYEFSVSAVDINNNESGRSSPIFLQFLGHFAKIPINLKIEQ